MKKLQEEKGFTLIELLVVVAIIGLLSTLSIVALNNARARARDARRVADVKQMQTALELYYNDNGTYPASISLGSALGTGTAVYMAKVPNAPTPYDGTKCSADNEYVYAATDGNRTYTIKYCLGSATGGVSDGIHYANPGGIQ